jgi:hypothetical protein
VFLHEQLSLSACRKVVAASNRMFVVSGDSHDRGLTWLFETYTGPQPESGEESPMRSRFIARAAVTVGILSALAGLSAQPMLAARASVKTNLCGLLSSSKAASVNVAGGCTHSAAIPFNYQGVQVATLTWVRWGVVPVTKGAIVANIYNVNPAYLKQAKAIFTRNGGVAVSVGSWGLLTHYDKGAAGITFGVGNYVVQLAVNTPGKEQLKSRLVMKARVTALAAAIAKRL